MSEKGTKNFFIWTDGAEYETACGGADISYRTYIINQSSLCSDISLSNDLNRLNVKKLSLL